MSDIFREVDEDLRQERFKQLWAYFGKYIIAGALVVVLGVGGYRFYDWYQAREAARAGDDFLAAVELARIGDHTAAARAFSELAERGGDTARLARFRAASASASAGDIEAAISGYDALNRDTGADALLRDAAAIRAAYLLVDTATLPEIQARVGDLTEETSVFRAAAFEVIGSTAYRLGEYDEARRAFGEIASDFAAPLDLRQRAERMLALLASLGVGSETGVVESE